MGSVTTEHDAVTGSTGPGLARLNAMPREEAEATLGACCSSRAWASAVSGRRPFSDPGELYAAADAEMAALGEQDVDEALAGHPRIGERKAGPEGDQSRREQAGVQDAEAETLAAIADGNREYEDRFGHVYLVCATGRSADELLEILRDRLHHDAATERQIVRRGAGRDQPDPARTPAAGGPDMTSAVTTHVLDTAKGLAAEGVPVRLDRLEVRGTGAAAVVAVGEGVTDADGRVTDLGPEVLAAGTYRLTFDTGAYFARDGRESLYPEVVVTARLSQDGPALPPAPAPVPVLVLDLQGDLIMGIVLGRNQYGKAENRVVRVYRDTARHEIRDINVSTALRGDFTDAHVVGDQSRVLPTDTQKNTCFAFAKEKGVREIEEYALDLARHFVDDVTPVEGATVDVEEYSWQRALVDGVPHDHTWVRSHQEVRTASVAVEATASGRVETVVSGLKDLVLLKSTGSAFRGFLTDEYTTLAETDDRVLATSLVATWRYVGTDVDWDAAYADIRRILVERFAQVHSLALQQTLWAMGSAVLEARPEVAEIGFRAPNRHHHLVDLAPFGLSNPGEVFLADDRPYGLIECTVTRDEADPPLPDGESTVGP